MASHRPSTSPRIGLPAHPSPRAQHAAYLDSLREPMPQKPVPPLHPLRLNPFDAQERTYLQQPSLQIMPPRPPTPVPACQHCRHCHSSLDTSPSSASWEASKSPSSSRPNSDSSILQKFKDGFNNRFSRPKSDASFTSLSDEQAERKQHKTEKDASRKRKKPNPRRYGVQYEVVVDHWAE